MSCFRNYERCVVDKASDFIDNLDCALEIVACIKDVVFGGGERGGGGGRGGGRGGGGEGGGGGGGGRGGEGDGGGVANLGFGAILHPLTDALTAVLLVDRELKPQIRAAHAAREKRE